MATEPSGTPGSETATATTCRCGALTHADKDDRCSLGHVLPGNMTAAVVGHRSVQFWAEHAQARRELQEAVIRDSGHDPDDSPPRALELAADGLAQAALIRDSAYERMVEEGGPLTSTGRTRRAFDVWVKSMDRLERHLRMVGLRRKTKPIPSLQDYLEQRQSGAGDNAS